MEHIKDLKNLILEMSSALIISDEQIDETGRKIVEEPVLVLAAGGERIGYIPISDLRRWLDSKTPSEITKALTTVTNKEEVFGIEDYGKEYMIGRDHMENVRYKVWRVDRPNVHGYGKTPNDAIYDLRYRVQPL